MRFAELHLLRYGRFEDCRLTFPGQGADLHVIYGPNEAGKSTTMSAVSDLLFGFHTRSPYDFRFDYKLLRVGAVIEDGVAALACVRKKGQKGASLLSPDEHDLDEVALSGLLAGYTADGFQRMFSLDHARLREGGRAILAAKDDVGQAIFAAGSGLIGVTAVLASLEDEAKTIRSRRAGQKRYYAAHKSYEDARVRQKQAQIRPAAWDDLNKDIKRLDDEITALEGQRSDASLERERVERRRRVLPHAVLYKNAQVALVELGEGFAFPADAATVLDEVNKAVETATVEATLADNDCVRLRSELEVIFVDQRPIESADAIDTLRETKGAVDKSLSDLPRRRTELKIAQASLASDQRELGWPVEDAALAKQRLPQRVTVAEVRDLLEKRSALEATLNAAVGEETAAGQSVKKLQDELAAHPLERNISELSAALKFARSLGDIEASVGAAQREVDRRQKALSIDQAQLSPWAGDVEALRNLILPSDAEATLALAQAASAETELVNAGRDHDAARKRAADLELRQSQLLRDDRAVSLHAVDEARGGRDRVWAQVRAHLLDETALPDARSAADDFEERKDDADAVADRRFASAEQSAGLAALQDEIERNALAIQQALDAVNSAEARLKACADAWQDLLATSALLMMPPSFSAWSDRRRRALESAKSCDDAQDLLTDSRKRLSDGRTRLIEGLGSIKAAVDPGLSLARLLEHAERLEAAGLEEAAERSRLDGALKVAEAGLQRAKDKVTAARADLGAWDKLWAQAVKAAALSAEVSHAIVKTQLELIETLRGRVDDILSLDQRIGDMDQDVADFGEAVLEVARACGLDTQDKIAADLLSQLTKAVAEAAKMQTKRSGLETQLANAEKRLGDAKTVEFKALARLRPLTDIAATADRTDLSAAIREWERAHALKLDIARFGEDVVRAGSGLALEALLAECEDADVDALTLRSEELTNEVTRHSNDIARGSADRAKAEADLGHLDAGPDAAIAAAEAEQAKAEMALHAEAYARTRAEAVLLKWAIAKYRSEKQTPLLKRASEIFSRLTLGRYGKLLVDLESDKARLAGVTADEAVVPVEGMSDGTVDQLFLSLRLAAVEEAVAGGSRLPFLADDLFINYDDERSAAGFQVLAELAQKTQVLFFTHHQHLAGLAKRALSPVEVPVTTLA